MLLAFGPTPQPQLSESPQRPVQTKKQNISDSPMLDVSTSRPTSKLAQRKKDALSLSYSQIPMNDGYDSLPLWIASAAEKLKANDLQSLDSLLKQINSAIDDSIKRIAKELDAEMTQDDSMITHLKNKEHAFKEAEAIVNALEIPAFKDTSVRVRKEFKESKAHETLQLILANKRKISHQYELFREICPIFSEVMSHMQSIFRGEHDFLKKAQLIYENIARLRASKYEKKYSFTLAVVSKLYSSIYQKLSAAKINLDAALKSENKAFTQLITPFIDTAKILDKITDELSAIGGQGAQPGSGAYLSKKKSTHLVSVLQDILAINQIATSYNSVDPFRSVDIDNKSAVKKMVSLVTIFQHSHLEQELYHWQIKPAWDEFMTKFRGNFMNTSNSMILSKKQIDPALRDSQSTITLSKIERKRTPVRLKEDKSSPLVIQNKEPLKIRETAVKLPKRVTANPSATGRGFYKRTTDQNADIIPLAEANRPYSSMSQRKVLESTNEDDEYLQETFHPTIKWKIV